MSQVEFLYVGDQGTFCKEDGLADWISAKSERAFVFIVHICFQADFFAGHHGPTKHLDSPHRTTGCCRWYGAAC